MWLRWRDQQEKETTCKVVTDNLVRKKIYHAERLANLHVEELTVKLGLNAKRIPFCVRYIGTWRHLVVKSGNI